MKSQAALGAWVKPLQELPPTLAQAVGPWLPRLAALSGAVTWPSSEPDGDPDGYGDLSQRGSYERLLSSEWALAQAQPQEFVRRAAMGEHLFLKLQRRRFRLGRQISVLFDAGPDQLGNPRLVHLAWLLVLAVRAQQAGAEFRWATLQQEHWAGEDAAEQDFQWLLEGRSRVTGASQVDGWREAMGAAEVGEERWWIGGRGLINDLGPADHVGTIVEPWQQTEISRLEVSLRSSGRGRAVRTCQLPLPEHRVRRLLLRGLLNRLPQIDAQLPAAEGDLLAFAPAGDRLIFAVGHDRLTARHLPRSRAADPGNPRWFELADTEVLIAAGFAGRRFITVTHEDESLRFRGAGTKSQRRDHEFLEIDMPPELVIPEVGSAAGPCFLARGRGGGKTDVCFRDAAGQLFVYEPQIGRVFCLVGRAMAVCECRGSLFAVVGDEAPLPQEVPAGGIFRRQGSRLECLDVVEHIGGQAFFGWRQASDGRPLIAVEKKPGVYRFLDHGTELRNSLVGTVVGVGEGPHGDPGLLILEKDRRTVLHIGRHFQRRLFQSPVMIRQIATSVSRPIWGALLEDGTVRVSSLRSDRAIFVSEVES